MSTTAAAPTAAAAVAAEIPQHCHRTISLLVVTLFVAKKNVVIVTQVIKGLGYLTLDQGFNSMKPGACRKQETLKSLNFCPMKKSVIFKDSR